MTLQGQPESYRFGPFQLDVRSHQLTRDGRPVKLQALPCRLLAKLVSNPGVVVTREELQRELWPDGTFVDYELGLNTAMRKLRQALSDDAENPRFVETIPKVGYRFIFKDLSALPATPERSSRRLPLLASALGAFVVAGVFLWIAVGGRTTDLKNDALAGLQRLTADSGLTFQPAISPDGRLVAYASDRAEPGNLDIWVMHADGGNSVRLTFDKADDMEPHFCPDGRIVFRSDRDGGGAYVISALGGTPILLAKLARSPRCSPDGKQVAFWIGPLRSYESGSVFLVSSGGGVPQAVNTSLPHARYPIFSPDGHSLLVVGKTNAQDSFRKVGWHLINLRNGTSAQIPMVAFLARTIGFAAPAPTPVEWDRSTGQVLFSSEEGQPEYAVWKAGLWSVQISSSEKRLVKPLRRLTSPSGMHSGAAAVAGTVFFADVELNPDIWSVPIDHKMGRLLGEPHPVAQTRNWESMPTLPADGKSMVFRRQSRKGWDFWRKDLISGEEQPVTISGGDKVFCAISRDGSLIAYHTESTVEVASTKTGQVSTVCKDCRMQVADWTLDANGLIVVNLDTQAVELIQRQTGARTVVIESKGSRIAVRPRLSPDGKWILFRRDGLYLTPFSGPLPIESSRWRLLDPDTTSSWYEWSPSGEAIYFVTDREGPSCLWFIRTGDEARPEPLMHFHRRASPLHGGIGVGPDKLYLGLHETTANIWKGSSRPGE